MNEFLRLFADATTELNLTVPGFQNRGRTFNPGIGPYSEDEIVNLSLSHLSNENLPQDVYIRPNVNTRRQIGLTNYVGLNGGLATPDLVYQNKLIEFKICRPLRDNGQREDTWFKKVFEPNPQSKSTFSDVFKLCNFRENHDINNYWSRWVVIIGFERQIETEYRLDSYFPELFNHISTSILNRPYIEYISCDRDMGNRHPHHQVLKLYAFRY